MMSQVIIVHQEQHSPLALQDDHVVLDSGFKRILALHDKIANLMMTRHKASVMV